MARTTTHREDRSIELLFGESSCEIIADYTFTYTPGCPATGPSYASGGDPAEDPQTEVTDVCLSFVDPKTKVSTPLECPAWLREQIIENAPLIYLAEKAERY
jgi:hypothetical protein